MQVGTTVQYFPQNDVAVCVNGNGSGDPIAAVVTHINPDGTLNLRLILDGIESAPARTHVPLSGSQGTGAPYYAPAPV